MISIVFNDEATREVALGSPVSSRRCWRALCMSRWSPSGLDVLKNLQPSAAIIDFIMPGMNGAEVARLARLVMPRLPVVFVSGYFDTVALDVISGAIVVRKPIDIDSLQRTISSVLR